MLPKQNKKNLLKYRILFGFFTGVFAIATASSIFSLIPQNKEPLKSANALSLPATCSTSPELCFSKRNSESGGFGTVDFLFLPKQGSSSPVFSDTRATSTVTLDLKNLSIPDDAQLAQTYICTSASVKDFSLPDQTVTLGLARVNLRQLERTTPVAGTVNYSTATGCGQYKFSYADRLALSGSIGLNYEFVVALRRVSDSKLFIFRDSYIYTIGGGGTAN